MTNDFSWYRRALADPSKIGGADLPLHESEPQPGYYRARYGKQSAWTPIAIWYDQDTLHADDGGTLVTDLGKISQAWTYCCRHPIPEALYFAVAEDGAPWPDAIDEPAAKPNADPLTQFAEAIDELAGAAARDLAGKDLVADSAACDQASNYATRLTELAGDADKAREAEKRPHLERGRQIDALWTPVRDRARAEARALKDRVGDALKARREAAKAIGVEAPTKAGTRGKVVILRKVERLVIADKAKLFAFLARHDLPDLDDVARKLADRMRRAGVDVPGIEIIIEEQAA